ncbi:hypothetical protein [Siphonobacter sp. SORGH_AS_0500]|uniref:hypothetical protein n=1 Tax=Siphonobacter sp. SORGH_AS_0500 TaxID=1864824 RepID=UPI00285E6D4C|nr:hypothetical protein [Siphonobacter sp. SORGH_AS_0500]MDR6193859.1 hypothetical protein [Siphonobacter sp. SORGH_AS_0500]
MRTSLVLLLCYGLSYMIFSDLFGYHDIGNFPSKAAAQKEALHHLSNRFYLIFGNDYKIIYRFEEKGSLKPEAMHYNGSTHFFGLENDIHSGPSIAWKNINHSQIKHLLFQASRGVTIDQTLGPGTY